MVEEIEIHRADPAERKRTLWLLLGLALARNLTRPLRRLTAAIHAMAAGDLEQRVSALETTVADVDEFAYGPNVVPDMSLSPMFDPNYTFFVRCEARDQPYSYRDYAYLSCERIVPPLSN